MKQKFLPAILVIILMTFFSCQKDDNGSNINGEKVSGTVTGRVFDENGQAVSGATVYAGDKSAVTDQWGIFLIQDALFDKERCIIKAEKNGYWQQTGAFHPSTSAAAYANLTLFSAATTHTFDASSGATLNLPKGAKVVFPAGAIATGSGAAYSGTVYATIHELPTDDSGFAYKIPGTDLRALNASNEEGVLLSYGMLGVVLEDASGAELNLKAGTTAQITIPIAADQQSSAPASIALWYFDEAKGMWKEDGLATKSGNQYVGSVSHFTWWNCDIYGAVTLADGYVLDCNGQGSSNAYVFSSSGGAGLTDANGYYYGGIGVGSNVLLRAWQTDANGNYYFTLPKSINAQVGIVNHVPDLTFLSVSCPGTVTGILVDCNGNPTAGMVVCVDSLMNLVTYTYTSTGSFSLATGLGTFQLLAFQNSFGGSAIASVSTSGVTNIGNLPICDSLSTGNNIQLSFSSVLGTMNNSFAVQSCNVDSTKIPSEITFLQYDATTQQYIKIKLRTSVYAPGTYNWFTPYLSLEGDLIQNGTVYHIQSTQNTGSYTTLTNTPAVGGTVSGNFSGVVNLSSNTGQALTGTLNATFNIYRNH